MLDELDDISVTIVQNSINIELVYNLFDLSLFLVNDFDGNLLSRFHMLTELGSALRTFANAPFDLVLTNILCFLLILFFLSTANCASLRHLYIE